MKNAEYPPALWSTDPDIICQGLINDCPQGIATFDGRRGSELEITFGSLVDTTIKAGGGRLDVGPIQTEPLYGFSRNGNYLVLRDVTAFSPGFSAPGGTHQKFHASSMLVSRKCIWHKPLVKRLHVDIPGLREWLCSNPVKHIMRGAESFSYTYDASDSNTIILYESDLVLIQVLRMVVDQPWNRDKEAFSIEYECRLEIVFKEDWPALDDAVNDWVIPMWEFLCFCMGTRPTIEGISFECLNGIWGNLYQCFTGKQAKLSNDECDQMPLTYKQIKDEIGSMIEKWITLEGDAKRAATSLVSLLDDWIMPINLIFISCATSFEALSRVNVDIYRFDENELKRRLDIVSNSINEKKVKDWVMAALKNQRRKRADDLARSLLKEIRELTQYIVPDREKFLIDHRGWRNNYIHQEELTVEQQDLQALWVHTWAVWLLGYGSVARLIGIPPEKLVKQLKNTRFMSNRIYQSQRQYSLS